MQHQQTASNRLLRLRQIIGDSKRGIDPLVPVCASTWWAGVKAGRYPQPVKIGRRATAWRYEDVAKLIAEAK